MNFGRNGARTTWHPALQFVGSTSFYVLGWTPWHGRAYRIGLQVGIHFDVPASACSSGQIWSGETQDLVWSQFVSGCGHKYCCNNLSLGRAAPLLPTEICLSQICCNAWKSEGWVPFCYFPIFCLTFSCFPAVSVILVAINVNYTCWKYYYYFCKY